MPVYEYYCEKCDKTYEFFQRITDDPKTVCEVCGGVLKKQISLSAFHLKGSGWYVTDYKGKNGSVSAPTSGENGTGHKEEEKPAKTESAGSEKKESKPKAENTKAAASFDS